ncbi:MAG: Ribonuclease BN [Fimbriimonadaceae bacterium]|nr:Ribonuclease BN [Fimbriimonadaceae bacterium]
MIEAIVLGSGTSNGVPSLGIEYPQTFLRDPRNHRTRTSLLLRSPEGTILVDCAPEMRLQLLREGVRKIDGVIVTHTHADHIMGMDDLRSFCLRNKSSMPIYAWPEYQADLRRVFAYAFKDFPDGIEVPRFELRDLPECLTTCGIEFEILRLEHGPWPVAGLRIGGLAYLTDVGRIPPAAMERLQGLDCLILDAVRYKPHPNHFNFEQAMEVAAQLAARITYFTHLSHDYDHAVVEAELPPQIRLAFDGLRIRVAAKSP